MSFVTQLLGHFGVIPQYAMGSVEPLTVVEQKYWADVAHAPPLLETQGRDPRRHITTRDPESSDRQELEISGRHFAAPELPHYPTLWTPFLESARYYANIPINWILQIWHLRTQIAAAFEVVHYDPMPGGILTKDHPWVTGIDPESKQEIWPQNVLFGTQRSNKLKNDIPDDIEILKKTGWYLASRVRSSIASEEYPEGKEGRMPHGINYMHGASHYNSGWLIFNDVQEAIYFLSDQKFINELKRFARQENREILIVLRDKDYDRFDLLFLASMIRTTTSWFANNDGPRKVVGWGNPAPYPTVNPLTGGWIHDVFALKTAQGRREVVRAPIPGGEYFQGHYEGTRIRPRLPEYLLGLWTERRVLKKRGDKLRNSVADPKLPEKDHLS